LLTAFRLKDGAISFGSLFLASFVIYFVSLDFYFLVLSDDSAYIFRNPYLQSISFANTAAIFSNLHFGDYLPVNLLSYSWDFTWWGFDPFGYHLSQVILHSLNACLLFAILGLLQVSKRATWFSVLIFVAHPVQVESVVWISERKNLLSCLFILLSLWFYLQHAMSCCFRRSQYYLCLLSFALALLSKSIAVMLPCIFVLLDLLVLRRKGKVMEKIPFFLLSMVMGLATITSQGALGGIKDYVGGSFAVSILYTIRIYWDYLACLIFPFHLSPFYFTQSFSLVDRQSFMAYLFFMGTCFYVVRNFRSSPYIIFAIGWFVVWLLPVSNLIPISTIRQDRYLYLPSIAVIVMIVIGLESCIQGKRQNVLVSSTLVGGILLLGSLSFIHSFVYASDLAFWRRVANQNPKTPLAQQTAGDQCSQIKDLVCAEKYYRQVLAIEPEYDFALNNLGALMIDLERYQEAQVLLKKAIQANPTNAEAYSNLIMLAKKTGLGKETIPEWKIKFNLFKRKRKQKQKDYLMGEFRFR
jgi:protein O-mannosyl-transferase